MAATIEATQRAVRTAIKASIKRASKTARQDLRSLDGRVLADLDGIYRTAATDLQNRIATYGDGRQTLRLAVLQELLGQVRARLGTLSAQRDALLNEGLEAAAAMGVRPFAVDAARVSVSLTRASDEALRFVRTFVAEDGLQLSDRLWRLDRGAREAVAGAIEQAVIQGHSASQAAQEFLARGVAVPRDIQAKVDAAAVSGVQRDVWDGLMTGEMTPYDQARRVFRTELNRAHGEAYQAAAFEHPDVIGTRFLLSPRHPRPDICDMHAMVNRYGLGPGVYPEGRNPWPAHPNTLSFVEVVFEDEVTPEDRQGKEGRIEWLKEQPGDIQVQVVGGLQKREALARDILKENEINTPWKVLKTRYERRGLEPDRWTLPPPPPPPPPNALVPSTTEQASTWAPAFAATPDELLDVINRFDPPRPIPADAAHGAYHQRGGVMMGSRLAPDTPDGRRSWRHEYGHYIDYRLRRDDFQFYASDSPAGYAAVAADAELWKTRRKEAFQRMRRATPTIEDRFQGRRFSERAYHEAQAETLAATSRRLEDQAARTVGPEPDLRTDAEAWRTWRHDINNRTSELAIAELESRNDIYRRVFLTFDERHRPLVARPLLNARAYDDLAYIAGSVGNGHESYLNIMDLVGSITLNKAGRGHSNSYYRAWRHRQPAEAFANTFDLMTYGAGTFEEELLQLFAPAFYDFAKNTLGVSL